MTTAQSTFDFLIQECIETQASDLHLSSNEVPFARIQGKLQPLRDESISAEIMNQMAELLLNPRQQSIFEESQNLDLSYANHDGIRFRINLYRERGQTAMAIRRLDNEFRTLEELHLPEHIGEFADLRDGLVLVTGPTGSGKTTTLATMLHQINCSRSCHIITIEDPIEYLHSNRESLVHQRELHTDVPSFSDAVRASLREDPDVILVGEMRDTETMRAAITAAETGHLVFSTLHTGDAVGAIDRMIGAFPAEEQDSVRQQVSMVLKAVVAQRLLPRKDVVGRVPIIEILKVTNAVGHLIRTGKPQQIYSSIETGTHDGMQTLEHSLAGFIHSNMVELEDAKRLARDPKILEQRLQMLHPSSQRGEPNGRFARRTH